MQDWKDLKAKLLEDPEVLASYEALGPEYELLRSILDRRLEKGYTQTELAKRAGTKQSAISRLESGEYNPTIGFLQKIAGALGAELAVGLRDR